MLVGCEKDLWRAALALGLGLPLALLTIAVPILYPTVVMRSEGAGEACVVWT